MTEPRYIEGRATFDATQRYRYRLWRVWDEALPSCLFVMLNPSTADADVLDPTVRRCLGYAQAWRYGRLEVVNLFALRSTDPTALYQAQDPVGPENDAAIVAAARASSLVVAAWGVHGRFLGRSGKVLGLLRDVTEVQALRLTASGLPSHPLYLPAALRPFPFATRRPARKEST